MGAKGTNHMVLRCTSTTADAVFQCRNNYSELGRDIGETANFATYFTGSAAAESTPHLYISSLATWTQDTALSELEKTILSDPYFHSYERQD